ncbi:GIN domain-containing protein [Dokdonia sp. 4H-3-7-5]|uniref:GIN domain-containing protein n=1 Tax=Dokdonia sp. (strain 4H-3-7-5) TaxID=983548 RepID=UPI0013053811|nr:DUF2807 domain-containing protein [Dokdonia sp. 4H-3-7-5]
MKKLYMKSIAIAVLMFVTTAVSAQRERVKGSRNVKDVSEVLRPFTDIKVTDGLEVTLIADSQPSYELEMDDNLIELISFDVRDSVLLVSARKDIRSAKRLNITVRFVTLNSVSLDAKSKVKAQSVLKSDFFRGSFLDDSQFEGEIKAKQATITANSNSKIEMDYMGDDLTMNVTDNAFAKADINTKKITLSASGRSDLELKGNAQTVSLDLNDNAECKAETFNTDVININATGSSTTIVTADQEIIVDLDEKAELHVYGEPKLMIERFTGTSKILKKE